MWLERKILPDTLLRGYIDNLGTSNDDASAGIFSKRPSRSERAVDDPIRGMEGMLVDEYGRYETFYMVIVIEHATIELTSDFLLTNNLFSYDIVIIQSCVC